MFKRKTVLVVRYLDCPDVVQNELSDWHLFGNDRLLQLRTSYKLGDDAQPSPQTELKVANFEKLYEYLQGHDGFTGSFVEFLTEYRLQTLHWIATQGPDLDGIDDVLLDVSW
jgi:hypothetical protein